MLISIRDEFDCAIIAVRIETEKDLAEIRHPSEQEFARFLLQKSPHLIITYEPMEVSYFDERGIERKTIPDFTVENPHSPNGRDRTTYVEITLAAFNGKDPKGKQKEVMRNAAPNARYIVLYEQNLRAIQRANPNFNPYEARKRSRLYPSTEVA